MPSAHLLRAGAAATDITPAPGTHLSGSGMGDHRALRSVAEPLYARALVLEREGRRAAVVALDVTIVTGEYSATIRRAGARMGFDPGAVMVHATQTHSAPSLGGLMMDPDFPLRLPPELEYLRGAETAYCEFAVERAVEALARANADLRPVRMGLGRAQRSDLAVNRRGEETIDPEVAVLCLKEPDGPIRCALLHYTCHPVNMFCAGWSDPEAYCTCTPDWPGVWAEAIREQCGEACVPIVLNGCCGNINPPPPYERRSHRRQGMALAETTRGILERMEFGDARALDWRAERLPIPYRAVPGERMEQVDRILAAHPEPLWSKDDPGRVDVEWFLAASTKSIECCRRRMPQFLYEIQALRVGECAVVGLPGEPFSEGQLALKARSPAHLTLVAHAVNQYVGYIPTAEAAARGGHEANDSYTFWAKLDPGALDRIVQHAGRMLQELFAGH